MFLYSQSQCGKLDKNTGILMSSKNKAYCAVNNHIFPYTVIENER